MLFLALLGGLVLSMKFGIDKLNRVPTIPVTDLKTFEDRLNIGASVDHLTKISVFANTSISRPSEHPVIQALISRWKTGSKPGKRSFGDSKKIALAIEGGGMRGCVAAGASAALNVLGLTDAIDVVYGSSAGAMVGAYFISRQYSGVQIYHDILPAAGARFIDKFKLLFAAGLPRHLNLLARVLKRPTRRSRKAIIAGATKGKHHLHFIGRKATGSAGAGKGRPQSPLAHAEAINLDFLLEEVMGTLQGLDWDTFARNEAVQPLKVVASSLRSMKPVVLSRSNGNFGDLPSLLECIRASMAVPGVTGSLMVLHAEHEDTNSRDNALNSNGRSAFLPYSMVPWSWGPGSTTTSADAKAKSLRVPTFMHEHKRLSGGRPASQTEEATEGTTSNNSDNPRSAIAKYASTYDRDEVDDEIAFNTARSSPKTAVEPVVDAFLCEPLPYRSAVEEGATHVIVLRTRPDPCPVLGKGPGFFEKFIAKRFFGRYRQDQAAQWMLELNHHRIYAEDVLRLNEGCKGSPEGVSVDGKSVYLLPIAPAEGCKEVGQLETRRDRVLEGMQDGARRVFEIFAPELMDISGPEEIEELVQMIFPDEILARKITLAEIEEVSVRQQGIDVHQ